MGSCIDPVADNYNPYAQCDDGSCTYTPSGCNDPVITGLYIDGIIDDKLNVNFDNMNTYDANGNQICRVDQIKIQYRQLGQVLVCQEHCFTCRIQFVWYL